MLPLSLLAEAEKEKEKASKGICTRERDHHAPKEAKQKKKAKEIGLMQNIIIIGPCRN